MIGVILTGHGEYASGLTTSLELIMGQAITDHFYKINFTIQDSLESLKEKIESAIDELDDCEEILICTDVKSGTPFNVSLNLALQNSKLTVVYGINLAVLMDIMFRKNYVNSVNEFMNETIEQGREQLGYVNSTMLEIDDESCDNL